MKRIPILIMLAAVLTLTGCQCCKTAAVMPEPQMAPMAYNPCAPAPMTTTSQSYPAAGAVRIEKMLPEHVNTNAPFEYRIQVTNLSDNDLENVMVSDQVPADLTFQSSTPKMEETGAGHVSWDLGTLEPKGSRTISVRAMAKSPGTLSTCAQVSYDCPTCAKIAVVEPKLMLTRSAPSEILSCDRLPLKYTIHNSGNGHACDITIEENLPVGLQTAQGESIVRFKLASLAPGESKEFETMVDATEPGAYSGHAVASAANLPAVESSASRTIVNKPVLALESSAPSQQYIGRPLGYDITVKNTGDGIAQDAVIVADVPENAKFVSATAGGNYTHFSPGKVTWNLGSLAPNASKTVQMELSSDMPGEVSTTATANAKCAEAVSTSDRTMIAGIPAVLLEVVDSPDPIMTGQNVTYTVTVTNQGSTIGRTIKITCMLEEGMEYVSSSGPTKASIDTGKISFEPLASLAPQDKAEWKVIVKAIDIGDMRFQATMTEAELTRPVEETEATRFYK